MDLEHEIFLIISHAGNAKSLLYEALEEAENADFDKAEQQMKQAEEELAKAHQAQTKLIQAELNGTPIEKTLLLIHAQDHLMTAISEKNMMERFIGILKKRIQRK
jgi:cellobiose PTS system EIIA component